MGRLVVTLENNGEVATLSNMLPNGYLKEIGARGFGVAPTALSIREGAGGGGRWRNTRRQPRDIDLPVIIFGEDPDSIETKMRTLVRVMSDKFTAPKIVVTYPDGSRFSADCHYAGGADHQYGVDTNGKHWARWPLTLRCPDPYWTAENAVSYPLRAGSTGRGLIRTGGGGLSRLRISSSQALGIITVTNTGDVDAYPTWVIKGPGDAFTATRLLDGQTFTYSAPLIITDTITIDTKMKTVTDQTGTSKYVNLATAPRLFTIPPGESQVQVLLTNATADSLVSLFFLPRRELVF